MAHVKFILGLACAFKAHSSCILLAMALVVGPLARGISSDLPSNALRLVSTHPDTYNLVGFSGCLHLWWIPLRTPKLLTPELCVTSVTMNQFSLRDSRIYTLTQTKHNSQ